MNRDARQQALEWDLAERELQFQLLKQQLDNKIATMIANDPNDYRLVSELQKWSEVAALITDTVTILLCSSYMPFYVPLCPLIAISDAIRFRHSMNL
jgi:hypothetical protein